MYERRRQAASLASLLVVTTSFVWSCSSSDHEEASVTTSGGSGSVVAQGGARSCESEAKAGSESSVAGANELGAGPSGNDGGSTEQGTSPDVEASAGGMFELANGGTHSFAGSPSAAGGTIDTSRAGAADDSSGGSVVNSGAGSAGLAAAGGAPPLVERVCDPADDHSTSDMVLPCDVSSALYVCRTCHANPPVKGVFSSYVTYADIKANAAQIYGVIKSGTMPWPPYTLSVWQKNTALRWLGKNGSCAIGAEKSCQ